MSEEVAYLRGRTIDKVIGLEKDSEVVEIITACGKVFKFFHDQDCCEEVKLVDFDLNPDELVGAYVTSAYLSTSSDQSGKEIKPSEDSESWTWSFYRIVTDKGTLSMRWLGESNGWYSESVELVIINDDKISQRG